MEARVRDARGRDAASPAQIPRRGWKDILLRTKDQVGEDRLSMIAAGVAFYLFLAIFPALAAAVSIAGLVIQPQEVGRLMEAAGGMLPPAALTILERQVQQLAGASGQALGWGLALSVGLALWSATAGMKALMMALNVAYDERERRGFIKYYGTAILLTLGAMLFALVALALIAALPALLGQLPVPSFLARLLGFGSWVILAGALLVGLAALYRFAPCRAQPQWRWVSPGAVVATLLWILGSALFSFYVTNFGNYNKTYGALGAIVILLTWFYLTAFVILFGAELNAETEHQTKQDSTTGRPTGMGRRNARMADSLGDGR